MAKTVISVDSISKMYDLGIVGTGTLSRDLNRAWAQMRGKPDPYATLAEINDRTVTSKTGSVWALKDVSFDVVEGEVLGIIGKNGAGKSTLLKILSQITAPSTGEINIRGRVASLLEVGTGMHPEMTARQNIYLNGSIMGMTRHEVNSKFDEIVDFAGVAKYVDTPIKRFSSGMKVRLGFSVAAFLEPEILIVDEVLAVGDAEFQRKAVGKMQDVNNNEGRTVLFVSHNMTALLNLCPESIYLEKGMMIGRGKTETIIRRHITSDASFSSNLADNQSRIGVGQIRFADFRILDKEGLICTDLKSWEDYFFDIILSNDGKLAIKDLRFDIGINNYQGERVAWISTSNQLEVFDHTCLKYRVSLKSLPLSPGEYTVTLYCEADGEKQDWLQYSIKFNVIECDYYLSGKSIKSNQGNILLNYKINRKE